VRDISTRSRLEFAFNRYVEHFLHMRRDPKAIEARIVDELKSFGPGQRQSVDAIENITPEVFEKYFKTSTPVVLKGFAKNWPCMGKWSPSYLKATYGDQPLEVMDDVTDGGIFNLEKSTIGEFMDRVDAGDKRKHLRFGNLLHRFPELKDDFDNRALGSLMGTVKLARNFGAFIGAKGTQTPLHAEPFENLFVQVYGVKRWTLIHSRFDAALKPAMVRSPYFWTEFDPDAPDHTAYPATPYLDMYQVDVEPGDVLYNPASCWHKVTNQSATIGIGCKWISPEVLRHNFSQISLFFMATNPSLLTVAKNKKSFAKVFAAAEEGNRRYFAAKQNGQKAG